VTLDAKLNQTVRRTVDRHPEPHPAVADGSLVATTTFVSGHSYADTAFSPS